jgi:hypothetical protein
MKILRSIDSGGKPLLPSRWEITFISYLLVAIQARDARIKRLEQFERVAILRSAHARPDQTFTTSASFIIGVDGVKLLAGRHLTGRAFGALVRDAENHERATSNVRQFPARTPRPTTPTHTRREAA